MEYVQINKLHRSTDYEIESLKQLYMMSRWKYQLSYDHLSQASQAHPGISWKIPSRA